MERWNEVIILLVDVPLGDDIRPKGDFIYIEEIGVELASALVTLEMAHFDVIE